MAGNGLCLSLQPIMLYFIDTQAGEQSDNAHSSNQTKQNQADLHSRWSHQRAFIRCMECHLIVVVMAYCYAKLLCCYLLCSHRHLAACCRMIVHVSLYDITKLTDQLLSEGRAIPCLHRKSIRKQVCLIDRENQLSAETAERQTRHEPWRSHNTSLVPRRSVTCSP